VASWYELSFMDGWMDGRMDGWMDGWKIKYSLETNGSMPNKQVNQ
jgi:hypothetical protein